ncbi:hypothetical protein INT48_006009 [Thamnidium elegans]|uniref:Uncharacterized protein n=1 Tax=Thamnidium elegans TaxID=101142 RepID=A0A8H7SP49_9FUNG|nr:hypothetical protein INT48_006009 [Thamnidium elegans]
MTIAKKATNKIIRHLQYEDLPNEEEIPVFKDLYDRTKLMYDADFLATEPEYLFDYESAKTHPLKFLRVSYRLLQEALSLGDWQVKVWCLLPSSSTHCIVYFPLNSYTTMHGLFHRAYIRNIRIPNFSLGVDGNLIGITAFSDMYTV